MFAKQIIKNIIRASIKETGTLITLIRDYYVTIIKTIRSLTINIPKYFLTSYLSFIRLNATKKFLINAKSRLYAIVICSNYLSLSFFLSLPRHQIYLHDNKKKPLIKTIVHALTRLKTIKEIVDNRKR